jgi:hypothetical protein
MPILAAAFLSYSVLTTGTVCICSKTAQVGDPYKFSVYGNLYGLTEVVKFALILGKCNLASTDRQNEKGIQNNFKK